MAKFLLMTLGSAGDVNPFLALGEELLRRGHDAVVLANSFFEKAVRSSGLEFASIESADEYLAIISNPDIWDRQKGGALIWNALIDKTPRIVEAVRTHAQPGSVLIANRSSYGAFVARELFRLPLVSVVLNPMLVRSVYSPPDYGILKIPTWTGHVGARIAFWLLDRKLRKEFLPPLNRVRLAFGLAPIRDVRIYADDVETIACAWSESLYGKQPDWPKHAETVGFLFYDHRKTGEVIAPIVAGANKPPIVFTLGTAMCHGHQFFRVAVQLCKNLGLPAILVSQDRAQIPEKLPSGVRWVDHAPFEHLLPQCAAIVHHGGIGTCARALQAGIPQVIVPLAHDQFDNAARLVRLGVARIAPYQSFSQQNVGSCLEQLLQSATVRENCRKFVLSLRMENGLSRLADIAESLVSPSAL